MFDKVTPASIINLRNAVRKELYYSNSEINDVNADQDYVQSLIGKLNCDPRIDKEIKVDWKNSKRQL